MRNSERRSSVNLRKILSNNKPLFLSLPAFLIVIIFVYGLTLWNLGLSLYDIRKSLLLPGPYVGLQNYVDLFNDSMFWHSFLNTLLLFVVFIPSVLIFSFFLAGLLDQNIKFENFFKWAYILPISLPPVVAASVWGYMYSPEIGFINNLLEWIGLKFLKQPWTASMDQVMFCIFLAALWTEFGFCTLMYLAYIRSMPKEIAEAARIDGASTLRIYTHIYFPMLTPAHFMLMSFMSTFILFGIFDLIWVMTGGGPAYSSHVLATFMVALAWNRTLYGYGAAAAEVLLALCSGLIAYYMINALKGA